DFLARRAIELPSLGIYTNSVNPAGVLAPAPNGGAILGAMPDGNVMLYDANADTFTVSRKDFASLSGAYAASSYNSYVVGSTLLNASLVPSGVLETASGAPSGFAFIDQNGFRTTSSSPSAPGIIERFDATQSTVTGKPTRLVEAPLLASATGAGAGAGSATFPTGSRSGTGAGMSFLRSLAPLYDRSAVIALSVSGARKS